MTNYFCSFGGNGGGLTRENHPINMIRDMSGRNDHGEMTMEKEMDRPTSHKFRTKLAAKG